MKEDFYDILDIQRRNGRWNKKSLPQKAIQYHPDKNPDNKEAEAKFKQAAEAYEILSDPQKSTLWPIWSCRIWRRWL